MNLFLYTKFNQPNTLRTWFGHLHEFDHLILETFKFTSKESKLAKYSILKSLSFFFDISSKKLFLRFSYISNCLLCNFDFKSKRMPDNRQKDVPSIYTLFEFAHFFWFTTDFTHCFRIKHKNTHWLPYICSLNGFAYAWNTKYSEILTFYESNKYKPDKAN